MKKILILFIIVNSIIFAQDDINIKKALNILANENIISGKYTDSAYEKRPTEFAWAFSVIAKSKNATELFLQLAHSGSFYGLIGLAATNRNLFDKEVLQFRGAKFVMLVDEDFFQGYDAGDFVRDQLSLEPKRWYDQLVFDVIPPWQDTVKDRIPPELLVGEPCKKVNRAGPTIAR